MPRRAPEAGEVQLFTRIEPDLKDALARWAKEEGRTIASQVRIALWQIVPQEFVGVGGGMDPSDVEA